MDAQHPNTLEAANHEVKGSADCRRAPLRFGTRVKWKYAGPASFWHGIVKHTGKLRRFGNRLQVSGDAWVHPSIRVSCSHPSALMVPPSLCVPQRTFGRSSKRARVLSAYFRDIAQFFFRNLVFCYLGQVRSPRRRRTELALQKMMLRSSRKAGLRLFHHYIRSQ